MSLSEALARTPKKQDLDLRESNPMSKGVRQGLIFVGAAAVAITVFLLARNVFAKDKKAEPTTPTPTPSPTPIPPFPPTPAPTPGAVEPKQGQAVPPWADPNPYGYNVQPGDPYVSPTSLWIAPDCSRWKMGSQWMPEEAAPIIQGWINAGWDATSPNEDVYTLVGTAWAWGWEVGRQVLLPYLQQSNPNGPLCTEGFMWPWETRDYWRVASGTYDQQAQEWVWTCPAGYGEQPEGLGRICTTPSLWAQWTANFDQYSTDYPALFGEPTGLYFLIWLVWINLSAGQPWNAGSVQTNLDTLKLNSP